MNSVFPLRSRAKDPAMSPDAPSSLHHAARVSARFVFTCLFYGAAFIAGLLAIAGR